MRCRETLEKESEGRQGRAGVASVEARFTCALCGARFGTGAAGCAGCPLHSGCRLVHCPNCGFGFPAKSKWAEWVRRLIGGPRP